MIINTIYIYYVKMGQMCMGLEMGPNQVCGHKLKLGLEIGL